MSISLLLIILIILLVVALAGGGWGYGRYWAVGLSPATIILLVLLLTGNLNLTSEPSSDPVERGARPLRTHMMSVP